MCTAMCIYIILLYTRARTPVAEEYKPVIHELSEVIISRAESSSPVEWSAL